jgi:outer membrane protein assembly factor BamE (lipoprotein component of BamABCDE complex)
MRKALLILALITGLVGCASRGTEIKQEQRNQLVQGQTTRTQMIAMFGQPVNQGFLEAGKLSLKWVYVYATIGGIQRFQELVALFNEQEVLEKYFISDNNAAGARLGR